MASWSAEEWNRQYSPSQWSKRLPADTIVDAHLKVTFEATRAARQAVRCEVGVEYAEPGGPTLDIYHACTSDSGDATDTVFVYIHGGNWQALGTEHSGNMAIPFTKNGVTVVAIGYDLAPKVSMSTMVEQCRKACIYIKQRFSHHRIFITGHSAGGHLAACMLHTDWRAHGMETNPFCGAALISGMYDLEPVRHSYVNDALQLTDEEVSALSPARQLSQLSLPAAFSCLAVWGEQESPEYKRQSKEYIKALSSHGVVCSSHELQEEDHFSIVERLEEEDYSLTKLILQAIQERD